MAERIQLDFSKRYELPTSMRILVIISSISGILLILFGGIKTSENFRILSDFIQNILLLNLIFFLFLPNKTEIKIALYIGVFTMIFDFFLEEIAEYLEWWYPLGGTQYPPIIVVPLEMVLSFFLIGTGLGVILTFPEKIKSFEFGPLNPLKRLFQNPRFDIVWRIILLFINALIGTNGDYTAGSQIWVPGPHWNPLYTFFVWFGGGLITLGIYYYLQNHYNKKGEL